MFDGSLNINPTENLRLTEVRAAYPGAIDSSDHGAIRHLLFGRFLSPRIQKEEFNESEKPRTDV